MLNFLDVVILDAFTTTRLTPLFIPKLWPEPQCSMMRRKTKKTRGGSELSPFLNLTPCEWNPIFATRRENIKYATENKPYIEDRVEDDNVVRCFMKSSIESDACLPRADKVEDYCFGATLEALQAEKGKVGEPVAWLDERSSAGGGRAGTTIPRAIDSTPPLSGVKETGKLPRILKPPPPDFPTSHLQAKGQRVNTDVLNFTLALPH